MVDAWVQITLTQRGLQYRGSIPLLARMCQIGFVANTGSNPVRTTKEYAKQKRLVLGRSPSKGIQVRILSGLQLGFGRVPERQHRKKNNLPH